MAARASSESDDAMAAMTVPACEAAWRAPSQLITSVFAVLFFSDGSFLAIAA